MMKKYIHILLFLTVSFSASSQVWIEGFTLYSFPMKAWMASGTRVTEIAGQETQIVPESDLFTHYADPQFGGGVNVRYAIKNLVVGLQGSYVGYKAATEYVSASMFRLGPSIEYYFNIKRKFQPYIGGEFGLQASKVRYNKDYIDDPKFARTNMGIGPRAGIAWEINSKCALRLGASYVYLKKLPYLDITAGIAINVGDF
jgi:hypothetical protein